MAFPAQLASLCSARRSENRVTTITAAFLALCRSGSAARLPRLSASVSRSGPRGIATPIVWRYSVQRYVVSPQVWNLYRKSGYNDLCWVQRGDHPVGCNETCKGHSQEWLRPGALQPRDGPVGSGAP